MILGCIGKHTSKVWWSRWKLLIIVCFYIDFQYIHLIMQLTDSVWPANILHFQAQESWASSTSLVIVNTHTQHTTHLVTHTGWVHQSMITWCIISLCPVTHMYSSFLCTSCTVDLSINDTSMFCNEINFTIAHTINNTKQQHLKINNPLV